MRIRYRTFVFLATACGILVRPLRSFQIQSCSSSTPNLNTHHHYGGKKQSICQRGDYTICHITASKGRRKSNYSRNVSWSLLFATTTSSGTAEAKTEEGNELSIATTASSHQQSVRHAKMNMMPKSLAIDLPYESAIEVLRTYHSIHGDLVIPRRYTIPPLPSFPTQWHNVPLSTTVYNMKWWSKHIKSKPSRVYELNQLNFIWERLQPEWNLVLEALITYRNQYNHTRVPASFVVPHESSKDRDLWPMGTWGIPLGNCVQRIRIRGDFLRNEETSMSRRHQLDGLGFVWDLSEYRFEKFFTALKIFAKVDRQTQTMMTRSIKMQQHPFANQESIGESDSIGYYSSRAEDNIHRDRSTITPRRKHSFHHQSTDRALRVPSTFKIPSGSHISAKKVNVNISNDDHIDSSTMVPNPWPSELWGYPLGVKCTAIRQKELYIKNDLERQRALEELGFQWRSGNATLGWLEVVHAAAIYSKMHGRKLDVPINFVVPSPPSRSFRLERDATGVQQANDDEGGDWPWPEQLWGLPLGQRLKDIRIKGAYLTNADSAHPRRAQLDALGFVWEPKRGRRKRSLGGEGQ